MKNKEPGTFLNGSLGFTLIELMIVVALFSLAMAGSIGIYVMCQKMWHATSLSMLTNRDCNYTISKLVYGVETNSGLRSAAIATITSNSGGWRITCSNQFDGAKCIDYHRQASNIYWVDSISQSSRICDHVASAVVSTNITGVNIQLTLLRREGQFTATNRISTFVLMRNR